MLIGYARVSTVDQNLALQRDALAEAGCQKIFTEQMSGAVTDRPALHDALEFSRSGDTLIVWKLDRLARSMKQLIETVENLRVRGVGFRSLTEALDTTTAQGRLVFHMFGALAEFERSLIRERTQAGLAAARRLGAPDISHPQNSWTLKEGCVVAKRPMGLSCQESGRTRVQSGNAGQRGISEGAFMTKGLREILSDAQSKGAAVGHFNVSDIAILKAVVGGAQDMKMPVIVGVSEGERKYLGTRQIAAMIQSLRGEIDVPMFLDADHTHSLASALEAAETGFDSIVFDISSLPFDENVKQTRLAVEALKRVNPAIIVEGEIGDIGTGSEIDEIASETGALTTAEEAKLFVQKTGIDALAPAVGNRHGMSRSMVDGSSRKHLNLARIAEIKAATGCFLTLHGGSGTEDKDFVGAIRAGINIVHVNTELRVAWRRGLEKGLAADSSEVVPYKILPSAIAAVEDVVKSRLRLFSAAA